MHKLTKTKLELAVQADRPVPLAPQGLHGSRPGMRNRSIWAGSTRPTLFFR